MLKRRKLFWDTYLINEKKWDGEWGGTKKCCLAVLHCSADGEGEELMPRHVTLQPHLPWQSLFRFRRSLFRKGWLHVCKANEPLRPCRMPAGRAARGDAGLSSVWHEPVLLLSAYGWGKNCSGCKTAIIGKCSQTIMGFISVVPACMQWASHKSWKRRTECRETVGAELILLSARHPWFPRTSPESVLRYRKCFWPQSQLVHLRILQLFATRLCSNMPVQDLWWGPTNHPAEEPHTSSLLSLKAAHCYSVPILRWWHVLHRLCLNVRDSLLCHHPVSGSWRRGNGSYSSYWTRRPLSKRMLATQCCSNIGTESCGFFTGMKF